MDYYQGYEDAMRQTRVTRSRGLIAFVLRLLVSIVYSAFVYVPLLLAGYFLAVGMSTLYSNDIFVKTGLTLIIAYLIFSIVYFIKGVTIGLRNAGRLIWLPLWLLCVALTCGAQALVGQALLADFFNSRQIANTELWSWIGAFTIGTLIYSHYQFLTNVAPSVVFWSYRLGFMSVKTKRGADEKGAPQKSKAYFENAPMNISYKRE